MTRTRTPRWLMPAAFTALALTLGFMMLLVLLATMDQQVPPGSRYLVVIVLAIGAAFGLGGLGGEAAVRGNIPIPGAENHPLAVSVTGGVAVLIIVLLMRDVIVPPGPRGPDLTLDTLNGLSTSDSPPRVMVTAKFEGFSIMAGERLSLVLCKDPGCGSVLQAARVDDPRQGNMVVFLSAAPEAVPAGRLVLENSQTGDTLRGKPVATTW